jgi:pyruvate/2-oxoglutarate dehydrogenase complex dihydrolipoamide dehydrogenase (E3) component
VNRRTGPSDFHSEQQLASVDVRSNVEVEQVDGSSGGSVRVTLAASTGTSLLEGSDILVAIGRIPDTQNIGLDKTGVSLDARGYIQVKRRARLGVKH